MLVGEKIILRPLKFDDIEKTNQWRNKVELIKLTQGIRFPKTIGMEKDWFQQALNDRNNRNIYFGIDEIETGEYIGIVQLTKIDYISNNAILGFMIGEERYRGKGLGFEFSKLIISYSFKQLNLIKITSYVIDNNNAALKLFQKLGFNKEGILSKHFFVDGEYKDVVILSLFK